jgi:pimeloyl-ACP methyl ester carboxylesterase
MSTIRSALPAFTVMLTVLVVGCAPGFRYTDAPPLAFQDIDYGFPVEHALGSPTLAYIDQGTGPETLLLVHGLAANAGFWRYNIAELAQQYRVIAVDLPGFGKSSKRAWYPYTMSFYAASLARLVEELGVGPVTVVGHSMGGQVAMTMALRHPESVSRLVLAAPAGVEGFRPGEGAWLASTLTIQGIRTVPEDGIRRNLSLNFYTWDDEWEWMVEERARMARAPDFDEFAHAVVRSVSGMLDEPTTPFLERVTHPAVIIYGRYDHLIPNPYLHPGWAADVFREGARRMPAASLVELPGTGHMLMIESPDRFNAAVLEWLATTR